MASRRKVLLAAIQEHISPNKKKSQYAAKNSEFKS